MFRRRYCYLNWTALVISIAAKHTRWPHEQLISSLREPILAAVGFRVLSCVTGMIQINDQPANDARAGIDPIPV